MFQVVLVNVPGDSEFTGYSFDQVINITEKTGIEATIKENGTVLASFSPTGGWLFFNV